ncbi:hypothetical protein N658DRAFT_490624 [Parathielavia hyrcaniae]|uniref:Uncharacterized protein n=1 Tax=Parathielavia hyrcaniae TaxID=113614 RepID=A0AAN6Q9A1_9PEZI|nr:hypothetical protein N658DRAFT_490624 [Parathielavia hyrcaniae]
MCSNDLPAMSPSMDAVLAAELALDKLPDLSPWESRAPNDVRSRGHDAPFMWHRKLQHSLPQPAKDLVRRQQARFSRD